ncbi:pentapeptide repeat-containing protein, partial [Actinacidiphila oryziradicis]|uniref:pentapeptide repeat-containing protein n=1 Tax=Actinacidiphila oryziradicis TaxID=2571141 RepID=UPI0023F29640
PWPHCVHGADPVGCRGRTVEPHPACLAHMDETDRAAYLAALAPGDAVDHRGTTFTANLLTQLLAALHDPATGRPRLGTARFDEATFSADARFSHVTFSAYARFDEATFSADAQFHRAVFSADAWFSGAVFSADAWFDEATFSADAQFDRAVFSADAQFSEATFSANAQFDQAVFSADAWFSEASFSANTTFVRAVFSANARFSRVTFSADARFSHVTFSAYARFSHVTFSANARFDVATFSADAQFSHVTFSANARFDEAVFSADAWFSEAVFSADAWFSGAVFSADAWFSGAVFSANAQFSGAVFSANAQFSRATFEAAAALGPLACGGELDLSAAVFSSPVTITAATADLRCQGTRWAAKAALRLRYATVDLSDAVCASPLIVTSRSAPFIGLWGEVDETVLGSHAPGVRMKSLSGVDAAYLVLTDIDMTYCQFSGTVHLDQLRLEGECTLAPAPTGVHRRGWLPVRWTPRRTLAEEQHWRAFRGATGWTAVPTDTDPVGPAVLAPVYRQLRKSLEDGKNEPDAADFYYGEMEMRRNDPARPFGERALLAVYWGISGYGLRASRALALLLLAMTGTILALMLWGLPADGPKPHTTGRLTGQQISLTTDTPAPLNPAGPLHDRLTSERAEKALRVVVNSVIFRSSGQDLTTAGTYTEMTSRLLEPVLLGLAVLAVRGRVKR